MIKILVINSVALKKNGITTVIYDYFSNMSRGSMNIDIAAVGECDEKIADSFRRMGANIVYLPSRKKKMVKYFFSVYRLIKKEKYDIIYVHGSSATLTVELTAARLAGCKIRLVHSHNSTCDAKKADRLLRPLFYKTYTRAFACSTLAGEWLFPGREYTLLQNGRSIDKYQYNSAVRNKMRKTLGLDDGTLAVGHVGNLNHQKNHEFLINVFKALKEKNKNVRLYLMGYGYKEPEIRRQVKELKLEKDVVFLGTVSNVHEILQAMDVMCLPSLYEGLPLVVVEWQMAALPCLISDVITTECAFTDLVSFASLNDSYEAWADTLMDLAKASERERIKEDAAVAARKRGFDISENARKLQNILEELVTERG